MNKIIPLIEKIIDTVKDDLPIENIADAKELLLHDEWGEALSLICTQLYEYDIPISEDTYNLIDRAGRQMGMDNQGWRELTVLKI